MRLGISAAFVFEICLSEPVLIMAANYGDLQGAGELPEHVCNPESIRGSGSQN